MTKPKKTPTTPADPARVRLDSTRISVVVTCTSCPWWYGFALDKIEGWGVGARHQRMHHPTVQQAEQNLIRARKHARTSTR